MKRNLSILFAIAFFATLLSGIGCSESPKNADEMKIANRAGEVTKNKKMAFTGKGD